MSDLLKQIHENLKKERANQWCKEDAKSIQLRLQIGESYPVKFITILKSAIIGYEYSGSDSFTIYLSNGKDIQFASQLKDGRNSDAASQLKKVLESLLTDSRPPEDLLKM